MDAGTVPEGAGSDSPRQARLYSDLRTDQAHPLPAKCKPKTITEIHGDNKITRVDKRERIEGQLFDGEPPSGDSPG